MAKNDGDSVKLLLACIERGRNRASQVPPSICRVPSVFRDISPSCFEPRVVSIGPLHKDNESLQELQGLKESYLHDLMLDFNPTETIKKCLGKVSSSIDQIRASYSGIKTLISDVDLAMMMVMDACFILAFCFKHLQGLNKCLPNKVQRVCIAMDLILLENQIPFFVLQHIYECTVGNLIDRTLAQLLHKILGTYVHPFGPLPENFHPFDPLPPNVAFFSPPNHILGSLHKFYQPVGVFNPGSKPLNPAETTVYHSVVELGKSGVKFEPHDNKSWPMAMEFIPSLFTFFFSSWGKPTLYMPRLLIEDISELVFRNFIAYEQSIPDDAYYFTSYVCAMDNLIDTQEDVAELVRSKVLINKLGSNQVAADMINRICKDISSVDLYHRQELKQLDDYYNGYWPKTIAQLRLTYFSSPWSVIALFAAIVLFSLTVVQTAFTIKPSK